MARQVQKKPKPTDHKKPVKADFRISLPADVVRMTQAQIDALDPAQAEWIAGGLNLGMYDLYEIYLTPVRFRSHCSGRDQADYSLDTVNKVLVQFQTGSATIQILGIYPTTSKFVDPGFHFDRAETVPPLAPVEKNKARVLKVKANWAKSNYATVAYRDNRLAQWAFLKNWIHRRVGIARVYNTHLLCAVPRELAPTQRYVACSYDFLADGRSLGVCAKNKKINLLV
jgi:hypothetical protein